MALKPESSVMAGAMVAAITIAIYQMHLPSMSEVRRAEPDDPQLEASRKQAAWWAAGTVGAISLLTMDPNIFIIGGGTLAVMDYYHKHANQMNSDTGQVNSQYDTTSMAGPGDLYAVPDNGGAPSGFGGYYSEDLGTEYASP